jgi:hypothetical protein
VISGDQERIISVRGDPDHPANFGRLCTKGATLHLSVRSDFRTRIRSCGAIETNRAARCRGRTRLNTPPGLRSLLFQS